MTLQQKIKKIQQETGCTPTEACESLDIDVDAATLASLASEEKEITLAEIIEGGKTKAARVLVDIIEDCSAENKDRIAAAKIILIGSGDLPNIGISAYEERFAKFAALAKEFEKEANVVDVLDIKQGDRSSNRMLAMAS